MRSYTFYDKVISQISAPQHSGQLTHALSLSNRHAHSTPLPTHSALPPTLTPQKLPFPHPYPHIHISLYPHMLISLCPHMRTFSYARIIICSHPHMLTSPYAHILICSHPHMLTSSYAHIPICSHPHMLTSSYAHFLMCSHPHMLTSSYAHIHISSYPQPQPQPASQPASRPAGRPASQPGSIGRQVRFWGSKSANVTQSWWHRFFVIRVRRFLMVLGRRSAKVAPKRVLSAQTRFGALRTPKNVGHVYKSATCVILERKELQRRNFSDLERF